MSYKSHGNYQTVTPHNGNANVFDSLYIGTGGNVAITQLGAATADTVIFYNVPSGTHLPVKTQTVADTGTSALGIVGLY